MKSVNKKKSIKFFLSSLPRQSNTIYALSYMFLTSKLIWIGLEGIDLYSVCVQTISRLYLLHYWNNLRHVQYSRKLLDIFNLLMNLLDVISKRYLLTSTNLRIPESLIINVVTPHRYSADHEGGKISLE
jgi:hypothetical protein